MKAWVKAYLSVVIWATLSRFACSGETAGRVGLELSGFQLETAYRYSPDVSVVLNITPDHGDRYDDLEEYALAKSNILSSQTGAQITVLSADDSRVVAMADQTEAEVRWFSTQTSLGERSGFYLDDECARGSGIYTVLEPLSLSHDKLFGRHNRENALAALLAVDGLGLVDGNWDDVMKAYGHFSGLEHRLEWVREVEGVRFINDSKATNDEAAAVALRALPAPVVFLLAGGKSKGGGYEALVQASQDKVTRVIAFGEAGDEIYDRFSSEPLETIRCGTMAEAVGCSMTNCAEGTTVVLAPACSSFDEFSNYGVRGRAFKEAVMALGKAQAMSEQMNLKQAPKLDPWLCGAVLTLLTLGLVMVYSSSSAYAGKLYGIPEFFIRRQLLWCGLGLGAIAVILRVPTDMVSPGVPDGLH